MRKAVKAGARWRLALACVVLALAACGGGGGGGGGGGSDPPPAPVATAPSITSAPAAVTVPDGQAASFSVTASGTAPLSYQWLRNGTEIAGATTASYSLPAATLGDSGASFSVRVSNGAGNVTSAAAPLTVTAVAPAITAAPAALSVTEGQPASFSVTANGSAPLGYQWRRDGVAIAGATAATYTLNAAAVGDHGAGFSVVVSNAAGSVTSASAVLSVAALPASAVGEGTRSLWLAPTHTLALRSDGLLMGWGSNGSSQLGSGSVVAGSSAVQIATGVVTAGAGTNFSLAVDANGALWGVGGDSRAWLGGNGSGVGSASATYATLQAVGWPARAVRQVEGGWLPYDTRAFSFVLLADGTVWHLLGGREIVGGVAVDSPSQVPGLYDIRALARGHGAAAYAVRADGTVWRISITQSGSDGPGWMRSRADVVAGLAQVSELACGDNHCLALLDDGTVRAWGEGRSGELGHGVAASSASPVVVSGLSGVTHVAVSSNYGASAARTRDGRVFTWGSGELSARPGTTSGAFNLPPADALVPTVVPSLEGSTEVACAAGRCMARKAAGTVWSWGGTQEPVQVAGVNLVAPGGGSAGQLAPALRFMAQPRAGWAQAGQSLAFHAGALGRGALSWQWLRNGVAVAGATGASYVTPPLAAGDEGVRYSVRVSDGTETLTSAEATVSVHAGSSRLWPGPSFSLALRADGTLLGWGSNASRQLGSGASLAGTLAQQVASGLTRASAASGYGLGVDAQGGLWGWGADSDLWLGGATPVGGAALVTAPVAVGWPARRVRQAEAGLVPYAGARNSFVLLADGTVWQLPGDKTTSGGTATHTAVQVPGVQDVTSLAQGHGKAYAVRSDGKVWNIGVVFSSSEPGYANPYVTAVPELANVRRIVCGTDHCLALLADGTLRAWGQGTRGQLGQGAAATSSTPVVVAGLSGVTHIAVSSTYGASFARTADGKVYSWGAGELSGRLPLGASAGVPPDATQAVEIGILAGSAEVACSASHCLARQADGSVWAWGSNASGQLGVAALSAAQVPVRVTGLNLN